MIDENKLIDDLKQSGMIVDNEYGNTMIDMINGQPKIGEWIPCSERLPEQPEENSVLDNKPLELYLVSTDCGEYPFRAFWNGKFFVDGLSKLNNVIAWMPLPEPYKEEDLKCQNTR